MASDLVIEAERYAREMRERANIAIAEANRAEDEAARVRQVFDRTLASHHT